MLTIPSLEAIDAALEEWCGDHVNWKSSPERAEDYRADMRRVLEKAYGIDGPNSSEFVRTYIEDVKLVKGSLHEELWGRLQGSRASCAGYQDKISEMTMERAMLIIRIAELEEKLADAAE